MQKPKEIAHFLLKLSQKERKKYSTKVLDKEFIVYPGVFSPKYFNDTELFVRFLPYKKGGTMLEIGTGMGAITIIAILKGKVGKVVATDINPVAIKNAKENVRMYKLNKKITIIKSNLFDKLGNKKFDIIFFNAPFCFTKKKNLTILEKALFDWDYTVLNKFIRDCKGHIKKNGRVFLGFSTFFGDKKKLNKIANNHKRKLKVIKLIKTKRKNHEIALEILEVI